jgi:hypothetical protein
LVLGWYHHQNAGDDRLQHAITRWLEGHTLGFLPAGRRLPASYARRWDVVVVGGGGLLVGGGGVFHRLRTLRRRAGVPVGLVGVSAEAVPDELRRELDRFGPQATVAWFRDEGSRRACGAEDWPTSFVGPDLTWLEPFPAVEGMGTGAAFAAGPHAGLDEARWRDALGALHQPVRPWPLHEEGGADREVLRRVVPAGAMPSGWDLEPGRSASVVISTRYHGLQFGLQLGRPVVGVGDAPKVRRFLDEQGIGDWWLPADDPSGLSALLERLQGDEARRTAVELRHHLVEEARIAGDRALQTLTAVARPLDGRSPWRRLLPGGAGGAR